MPNAGETRDCLQVQMCSSDDDGACAYAVVAAVGERGVAAPLHALVRRQPAGALPLEVEQRVGEGGAVVGLLLGLAVAQ